MPKTQQVERPGTFPGHVLPLAPGSGVWAVEPHQPSFLWVNRQTVLGETFHQHVIDPTSVLLVSESNDESSSPGESHPQALTEPDVNLSAHPALIVQSQVGFHAPITQRASVLAVPHSPASEQLYVDGCEVV